MGITIIEAQQSLLAMNVAAYPHLKSEDAKKYHRKMHEIAYPRTHDTSAPLSMEQFAQRIGMVINGK